jgi:hypothetical protein
MLDDAGRPSLEPELSPVAAVAMNAPARGASDSMMA